MSDFWLEVLTWVIKIFTGYIPQGFLFVLFIYIGCKKRIDKTYYQAGFLLSIGIALVRNLPVVNGVMTLLNIMLLISIGVFFCKFPADKVIIFALLITIVLVIIEFLVIGTAVVCYWIKFDYDLPKNIMKDYYKLGEEFNWAVFGIPSSVILSLIVTFSYRFVVLKGNNTKGVKEVGSTD